MLPLDEQGHLLLSFQEERRQQRLLEAALAEGRPSRRTRLFRRSGELLVKAGTRLQQAAGGAMPASTPRLGGVGR